MESRSVEATRWMWRGVYLILATAWAWLMMVVGLLAILEWPSRVLVWDRALVVVGVVLLAMGQFVLAVVADRLFPRAHPRVTAGFEVAAWAGVALAIVLGVTL